MDAPDDPVHIDTGASGVTGVTSPARHPLLGVGLAGAAATLFAVNGTVSKLVLESGLSSLRLVEIRCGAAALVLLAISAVRAPRTVRIGARELGFVAVYGVAGIAMVQWLYLVAIARMPVSISLLIEFTAPLLVALWVRFVRRQPVRSRVWAALGLCVVGLAMVARVWAGLTLDAVGLLAAGLAAVSLAAYFLLGEHGLARRDAFSLAAWTFVAAAVFWSVLQPWWTFPFAALGRTVDLPPAGPVTPLLPPGASLPMGTLVVWIVLMGTVAPFLLVLGGLRLIGAARSGLIGTLEPVLAGLVAWAVLGEVLTAVQIAGAVVVLVGIVLAETSRPPTPARPPDPAAAGLAPT